MIKVTLLGLIGLIGAAVASAQSIEVKDGRPSFLYLQQHVQELKPLLHQAGISLMTVVGGNRWSSVCGKASYHSYSERSAQVGTALVRWMNEGVITPLIKGEGD